MTGIVPDVNIQGQVLALVRWIQRTEWAEMWSEGGFAVRTFADLGWPSELPDRAVWERCQAAGLILVTDNRNNDDPDSLEATLRDSNSVDSLPVLTVSDKEASRSDGGYAERVAIDLLEAISDLTSYGRFLGAGRVYLPIS